jgi:hypothetical protein
MELWLVLEYDYQFLDRRIRRLSSCARYQQVAQRERSPRSCTDDQDLSSLPFDDTIEGEEMRLLHFSA